VGLLVSLSVAAAAVSTALADGPPVPDFFRPYGLVQSGGANIFPETQPVVAFVRDTNCGSGATFVALPADGTPASDVGKTVFALNVLADGTGGGERRGCGRVNDPVMLYFPVLHALATPKPKFVVGTVRIDVAVGAVLGSQARLGAIGADGQ
jgi:hypothetical protein